MKQLSKLRVVKIMLHTFFCQTTSLKAAFIQGAYTSWCLLIHEGYCGQYHGLDSPGGGPRLFVIVGEGCADVFVCFKPTAGGEEGEGGWSEGVVVT